MAVVSMAQTKADFQAAAIEATRDAEYGFATCRVCYGKGPFSDAIVVTYSGAVVYAMCIGCAGRDNQILVRRGAMGVEVLQSRNGARVGLAVPDLGIITKRPA